MSEPSEKTPSRLEAILNNAVDAIITIDEKGIIESANPSTERLFGYAVDEIVGKNVKVLMPSPYQEEHDDYLDNYNRTGNRKIIGSGREVVGRRKDGTVFPMHLAVSEFLDNERRMFTGIVRDITDLKEAESQLKKLNEDLETLVHDRTKQLRETQAQLVQKEKLAILGQVSAGIAHEIRNPLNAVKTSVYYLVNARNRTEEKTLEHLARIDRQVSVIDNVVTALSDIAKLPAPNRSAVDIELVLRDVVKTVGLPHDVEVTWQLADDCPRVLADEFQLPIVFKNLVRNARDAMEDGGGTITIGIRAREPHIEISVQDTGKGIAGDLIGKILEPFYSTKARGMGLGLAITREIVAKNNGILRVESKEGSGSTFTVSLNIVTE